MAKRKRRQRQIDIVEYLEGCGWDLTKIDRRTVCQLVLLGRKDLTDTEEELLSELAKNNELQLEFPGYRTGRLQVMAARAQALMVALGALEGDAARRGLTFEPRDCGNLRRLIASCNTQAVA